MSKFEWHTEDEQDWLEEEPQSKTKRPFSGRWLLLPLLALAGFFFWQGIQRQIREAENSAETELRAAWRLLQQASTNGDLELVRPLISEQEIEWAISYEQLITGAGLYDRAAIGLDLVPDDPQITALTPGNDLISAVITNTTRYQFAGSILTLDQAATFRRGGDRWLFAPPEAQWWGEIESVVLPGLEITYPERDAFIVRSHFINQFQNSEQLGYLQLARFHLIINFSTDPESLRATGIHSPGDGVLEIELPTPSLVGRPQTESDAVGLGKAYGVFVDELISAEFSDLTGQSLAEPNAPGAPLPIPFPDAEVALACGSAGVSDLFAINPASGEQRTLRANVQDMLIVRELPEQNGLWIQARDPRNVALYYDGALTNLPHTILLDAWHPDEPALQLHYQTRNDSSAESYLASINPADCGQDACPQQPQAFKEQAGWSPNKELALVVRTSQTLIPEAVVMTKAGLEIARTTIDGSNPIWISDDAFAWRSDKITYKQFKLSTNEISEWLTLNDLSFTLSTTPAFASPSLSLRSAGNRAHPGQVVMQVFEGRVPRHLILIDVENDQLEHPGKLDYGGFIEMSPGGEWLISSEQSADNSSLTLQSYNQFTHQLQMLPITRYVSVHALKDNEDWFMIHDADSLRLFAPEYGFSHAVEMPRSGCRSAAWFNGG